MIRERMRDRFDAAFRDFARPTRSDWIFALRTVSAGLIALLTAYALKLDHPQWAMMTVFIVAQPVAGSMARPAARASFEVQATDIQFLPMGCWP